MTDNNAGYQDAPRPWKERPIHFSAWSVRAILRDRKTQTRRIVPLPKGVEFDGFNPETFDVVASASHQPTGTQKFRNRFGRVGDRLWVREAWSTDREWDALPPSKLPTDAGAKIVYQTSGLRTGRPRHGRHLPRRWSRILLEITEVRVQRLQEMTEADCDAEGRGAAGDGFGPGCFHRTFDRMWDAMHGDGSWASNPYVWAISFKRIP